MKLTKEIHDIIIRKIAFEPPNSRVLQQIINKIPILIKNKMDIKVVSVRGIKTGHIVTLSVKKI